MVSRNPKKGVSCQIRVGTRVGVKVVSFSLVWFGLLWLALVGSI